VGSPLGIVRDPVALSLRAFRSALGAAGTAARGAAEDLVGSGPDDELDERDPDYIRATLPSYRVLSQLYFRPKVRGLEHVPAEGPVLLVGNHSGGTLIADTFAFAFAFYSYFGADRRFYQLAHDLAVRLPLLSVGLRRYGTVSASHDNAGRALESGAAVLVYPGGDFESYRPSWRSGRVEFGGRSGFVRLALRHRVPIVPVVAVGGQETALFLTRGQRVARALRLDRMRLKVLPVQLAPPLGLTILDLPGRVPLPAQITIQVLPPVDLVERFGPNPDEERVYSDITEQMQDALDILTDERDLPVVGTVTPRSSQSRAPGERPTGGNGGDPARYSEPWPGYDSERVPEIARRLRGEDQGAIRAVRGYERARKARKGVLDAVERELRRR
jgi:1-acyl-sn-glycerol-3-phosphate acyltransferase